MKSNQTIRQNPKRFEPRTIGVRVEFFIWRESRRGLCASRPTVVRPVDVFGELALVPVCVASDCKTQTQSHTRPYEDV